MTVATTVTGWRYWVADPKAVRLLSPLRNNGGHAIDQWTDPGPRVASCRSSDHRAPETDCECGYRVVRDLLEVILWIQGYYPSHAARWIPKACPPLMTARVEGTGRVLPGVGDPENTWRVEHLRIVGPAYLSPSASYARNRFAEALTVPVIDSPKPWNLVEWQYDVAQREGVHA